MLAIDELLAEARERQSLPDPVIRRLLRERAGLTQDDLAVALGVSRPAVTRWESGKRHPRRAHCTAYTALLERLSREVGNGRGGSVP